MMRRWLLRVHHVLGSFAAVLVLFYALTGLLLNHPALFGLKTTSWATPAMVRHYGLGLPELTLWRAGPHWLTAHEQQLLLDGNRLETGCGQLRGTAWWQKKIWVNCDGMLLQLDEQGNERLAAYPGDELPAEAAVLGSMADGRPAWDSTDGKRYALTRQHTWAPTFENLLLAETRGQIPRHLQSPMLHSLFGRELSAWRIISDLHAGSFFGNANKLAGDITSLALVYLSVSGFYLYFSRRRKRK